VLIVLHATVLMPAYMIICYYQTVRYGLMVGLAADRSWWLKPAAEEDRIHHGDHESRRQSRWPR